MSALDDNVLEDYAAQLVPRGESYSAALLKYFFRGTMEITLPRNGVYAFRGTETVPTTQGFNKVNLLVKNTTSTGEQMLGGDIDLVVQYRFLTDSENAGVPKNPFISDVCRSSWRYVSFPSIQTPVYRGEKLSIKVKSIQLPRTL